MKTIASLILVLLITVLAWITMGWVALLVLPVGALAALMTLTPLMVQWAECKSREEVTESKQNSPSTLRTRAACA